MNLNNECKYKKVVDYLGNLNMSLILKEIFIAQN